jgi:hypothetical protein
MSRVTRSGGRMVALMLAATTAGVLFGAAPAHAADTSKQGNAPTWQDSTQFTFTSGQFREGRRKRVVGNLTLVIRKDGNWEMDSYAKNNRIAWRNVTFKCTLKYGAQHREIEVGIPRYRVDGKESKRGHREAYEPQIQSDWNAIAQYGQADCSMSLG